MFGKSGVRLFVVSSALLAAASAGSAQPKVAIINLQRAVLESAEIKKASTELEAKYKPRQLKVEALQKELQSIQQNLQANAGKLTPQAEADLTTQGQRKQRELQRLQQDLQEDADRDRNDILQRAGTRMQEVVKKLADEKGLDLVVDSANTLFYKTNLDLTADAVTAYNKAYPVK